jgi:hypothetical protein
MTSADVLTPFFAGQLFFCTMLSTAQDQKEWERAHTLLVEIRAHAAAHPDDPALPTSLAKRVDDSMHSLSRGFASPVATCKQLLKTKVGKLIWM